MVGWISRKVLTDHLKQLEVDNLIKRESFNESPPRVVYSLTKSAKALQKVLTSIDKWVVDFEMQ